MAKTFLLYIIIYLIFFAVLGLSKSKKGLRLYDNNRLVPNPAMLIVLQISGIALFGLIPAYLHKPNFYIFITPSVPTWPALIICFIVLLTIIISFKQIQKDFKAVLPVSFHTAAANNSFFLFYLLIRVLFIVAYEIWLRGLLLQDSIYYFGFAWAIVINISLYTLLHLVNGKKEALACIPFGLMLCLLCIWLSSPWPAVVIHLALTITYEAGFILKIKKHQQLQHERTDNRRFGLPG